MNIRTRIKYEESYIPPRCRKPRYKACEEFVDILLKEESMNNFQLAFEVKTYEGTEQIFCYQGELWSECTVRDICAGGEEEHGYHTALEALVWWREHGSRYFFTDFDRIHYALATDRESVLKKVQDDMDQYLLVDGKLFCRAREPRYCIYTFGLRNNHGGTTLSVDYCYNKNISKNRYFSALQGKEAVAEANRIAAARGDTDYVGKFTADIKVFMPELVTVNPETQHGDRNPIPKSKESLFYILENFNVSGEASRLLDNILRYAEGIEDEHCRYQALKDLLDGAIELTDEEIRMLL